QGVILRGLIEAGLHKTAYHVLRFVQPCSVAVTLRFPTQIARLLLGKTWQINLYSAAFQCAIMRNVNPTEYVIFPLKCSFTTVIRQTLFLCCYAFLIRGSGVRVTPGAFLPLALVVSER